MDIDKLWTFNYCYDEIKSLVIKTDLEKIIKIHDLFLGFGGSSSVIVYGTLLKSRCQKELPIIIKFIPDNIYINVSIIPDSVEVGIRIHQFLVKNFVLNDRTPHIAGIYNFQIVSNLDKVLDQLLMEKCPRIDDTYLKKYDQRTLALCDLKMKMKYNLIKQSCYTTILEFCPLQLSTMLYNIMNFVKNSKKKEDAVHVVTLFLKRIIFQIIFTLAIIKEDYPGFRHGDLFIRNILGTKIDHIPEDYFVAYHYKQKIFYQSCIGPYIKIIDFDYAILADELKPNVYALFKNFDKYKHYNPFNAKNDLFTILYDIYDGQNLGGESITYLHQELGLDDELMEPVYNTLHQFLDLNVIKKITKENKSILDNTWNIDDIPILEECVRAPEEYLLDDTFQIYQKLPKNAKIIKHFNKSR
jgi:hypothetical protein